MTVRERQTASIEATEASRASRRDVLSGSLKLLAGGAFALALSGGYGVGRVAAQDDDSDDDSGVGASGRSGGGDGGGEGVGGGGRDGGGGGGRRRQQAEGVGGGGRNDAGQGQAVMAMPNTGVGDSSAIDPTAVVLVAGAVGAAALAWKTATAENASEA